MNKYVKQLIVEQMNIEIVKEVCDIIHNTPTGETIDCYRSNVENRLIRTPYLKEIIEKYIGE